MYSAGVRLLLSCSVRRTQQMCFAGCCVGRHTEGALAGSHTAKLLQDVALLL